MKNQVKLIVMCCIAVCVVQCANPKAASSNKEHGFHVADTVNGVKLKHMLGINGFEWEFLGKDNQIDRRKAALLASFGGFRHYLDWGRIETAKNKYAYQPALAGLWGYDDIYKWCKQNNLPVLVCIKTIPLWLQKTYPNGQADHENAPIPYGLDKGDPASYTQFAKLGFQFAARYGSNQQIDTNLITVAPEPHWAPNKKKVGLGLITYIECNNEPDRWWKGEHAHQTAEEYAANLSAFYDGHLGKLGPGIGVKNADPSMQVVMGGLADGNLDYISKMIEWCRVNRGLRDDGTVNLCFDIINYHHYSFSEKEPFTQKTRGTAPELSTAAKTAATVVKFANEHVAGTAVWITELGYDINQESPLRTIKITDKTPTVTHADWSLRSSLLYARYGIKRLYFYMLNDVNLNNPTQFSSSGFVEGLKRRPSADYFLQVNQLIGEYVYFQTLNADPIVDVYVSDGKEMYVLVVPDEKGRVENYELDLGGSRQAKIHTLQIGSDQMDTKTEQVVDGKLLIRVTETPIFVEPI